MVDVKDVEDCIRDIKAWLAVFKREYNVSEEAYDTLLTKLEEIAAKVGKISPKKPQTVKQAADTLRNIKNWTVVFAGEYDLAEEAVSVLQEKFEELGEKLLE